MQITLSLVSGRLAYLHLIVTKVTGIARRYSWSSQWNSREGADPHNMTVICSGVGLSLHVLTDVLRCNYDYRLPACVCPSTSECANLSVSRSLTASTTSLKCSIIQRRTFDDSSSTESNYHPSSIGASILTVTTMRTLYIGHALLLWSLWSTRRICAKRWMSGDQ